MLSFLFLNQDLNISRNPETTEREEEHPTLNQDEHEEEQPHAMDQNQFPNNDIELQPAIVAENNVPQDETVEMEELPENIPQDQDNTLPVPEEAEHVAADVPRRSNRTPKFTARYKEFRKSIGLTALIGKHTFSNKLHHTHQLISIFSPDEFKAKHASALFTETFEPQSYKEALQSEQTDKWMQAFKEEYDSLIESKTWKIVPLPPNCSTINCKWIGRIKPAYDSVPERYKGRLVAIGTRQKYGIDYEEIFSPVPHQEAVKATLAEIASLDLEVIQFDIKTAFLYATLDKPIYINKLHDYGTKGWTKN